MKFSCNHWHLYISILLTYDFKPQLFNKKKTNKTNGVINTDNISSFINKLKRLDWKDVKQHALEISLKSHIQYL